MNLDEYPSALCDYEQNTAEYLADLCEAFDLPMFETPAFEALLVEAGPEMIDTTFFRPFDELAADRRSIGSLKDHAQNNLP